MLELIADGPLAAIPEIEPYTAALPATKLIALADDTKWTITKLGEAMLERLRCARRSLDRGFVMRAGLLHQPAV
jgi:hypothetical protein